MIEARLPCQVQAPQTDDAAADHVTPDLVQGDEESITSGTPPTLVATTSSPAAAASMIAMQNASVSDALMNICPRVCADKGIRDAST